MIEFIDYCPPCYPGSMTLPPVCCRTYTGRRWNGISLEDIRPGFHHLIEQLDAPNFIPAGSHCAPSVTVNGRPLMRRAQTIFPREIDREALA
jgi:hypothetical protein